MIQEIIKLREKGLSFRKIATELNTTVGRVQYRWNKWMNDGQGQDELNDEKVLTTPENDSPASETVLQLDTTKGELQIKLISPRKILLLWDSSDIPEKITKLFFNRNFSDCVQIVRIYDVTDIIFNGKNAHYVHEIAISFKNGHWFVKGLLGNRNYIAEIGVKFSEEHYFPLLRSNVIQTPIAELPYGQELYHDVIQYQQFEDHPPKWTKYVSTYSYYEESNGTEESKGYDLVTRRS